MIADLGPCPKCGSLGFFLSGCTACGYLPGMPIRTNPAPRPPEPAPLEEVRQRRESQTQPWRQTLLERRALRMTEAEMPDEKKVSGRPPKPFDPEKAKALRAKGLSIRDVALKLGVSVKRVRLALFGPRLASPVPMKAGPKPAQRVAEPTGIPELIKVKLEQIAQLQEQVAALEKAQEILTGKP